MPGEANAAKAEAMLGAMLGEAAEGDVAKTVHPTGEELAANTEAKAGERVQRVHRPRGASLDRDVLGRFQPDGTPKVKESKEASMARAGTKTPPSAETEERKDDGAEKAQTKTDGEKAAEKPAGEKSRADRAREQLGKLRAERQARDEAAKAKTEHARSSEASKEASAALEKELAATRAEKARWDAARTDPIAGFKELGLDPSQAFLELAQAAKRANTPEARIDAMQAMLDQRTKELSGTIEQLQKQIVAKEEVVERSRAESEFMTEAGKTDSYPYAHAYLAAEAKKQGVDAKALWVKAADHIATKQRADGKNPSYKSIAQEIEEYAAEVVLEMISQLPSEKGATTERAPATKATEESAAPAETKGKSTTIGNELTTARVSNANRRLSIGERMRKAERLV